MSTPAASPPLDARPLVEPVDRRAVRAYVRELRSSGRAPTGNLAAGIVPLVVGGLLVCVAVGAAVRGILAGPAPLVGVIVLGAIVLGAIAIGVVVARARRERRGERWWRLDRFARANAMAWFPSVANPPLPGMLFRLGHGRQATDVVRGGRQRVVEFGNYVYRTGSGTNESTHRWGYVAVKLSAPLPNIVLDAVGDNGLFGSAPRPAFEDGGRMVLRDDIDRTFTLHYPTGCEADALYLFTPDIVDRVVDPSAALDVEIVDDWLFLYTQREVSTVDPATWAWLFSVIDALIDKLTQWERWRADRLAALSPANRTAPEVGAPVADAAGVAAVPVTAPTASLRPPDLSAPRSRPRRRLPWAAIIIIGTVLVLMLFGPLGVFATIGDNLLN